MFENYGEMLYAEGLESMATRRAKVRWATLMMYFYFQRLHMEFGQFGAKPALVGACTGVVLKCRAHI